MVFMASKGTIFLRVVEFLSSRDESQRVTLFRRSALRIVDYSHMWCAGAFRSVYCP